MALTSPDSRDAGSHDVTQYVEVELGLAHLEASDLEAGNECSFSDGQHGPRSGPWATPPRLGPTRLSVCEGEPRACEEMKCVKQYTPCCTLAERSTTKVYAQVIPHSAPQAHTWYEKTQAHIGAWRQPGGANRPRTATKKNTGTLHPKDSTQRSAHPSAARYPRS